MKAAIIPEQLVKAGERWEEQWRAGKWGELENASQLSGVSWGEVGRTGENCGELVLFPSPLSSLASRGRAPVSQVNNKLCCVILCVDVFLPTLTLHRIAIAHEVSRR